MNKYLSLIRPWQWVKNLFILLPAFFAGKIFSADTAPALIWAILAFCLISSSIYCLNDIIDSDADARHPVKCRRPIASGAVSKTAAYVLMAVLAGVAAAIVLWQFSPIPAAGAVIAAYFIMNCLYCLWLKHHAIVDVFCIALGFVFRVILGGIVCSIWLSPWIVCMTFLIALFLAMAKRRDDVLLLVNKGCRTRENISRYNLAFLDLTLGIVGAVTMVCYIIYSVQPDVEARLGSHYVYVSSIFVLAGIFRYLQLTLVDERSSSPTKILLTDRFIQVCIIFWIAFFAVILYA